jgi:hypothetical protein
MRKRKGNTLRYNKIYKKTTGPVISYDGSINSNSAKHTTRNLKDNLHLSQKLLKQHLLVRTASFITSLHNGQRSSGGRSPTERVVGRPSISFSKAALTQRKI